MVFCPAAGASSIQQPILEQDCSITPSTTTASFEYFCGDSSTVASAIGFDEDSGAPFFTTSAAKVVAAASKSTAAIFVVFIFSPGDYCLNAGQDTELRGGR